MRKLRLPSPAMVVSLIALFVALSGTAAAVTVNFALNAHKVDGKHAVGANATLNKAAGKLVATAGNGRIPKKFISSTSIAFATISAESGTPVVTHFGGTGTTSVTVTDNGVGNFTVSFHGTYPGLTATSQITPLGSIVDTDSFDQASLSMDQGSASATQIDVRVFVWGEAADGTLDDRDFSVLVLR